MHTIPHEYLFKVISLLREAVPLRGGNGLAIKDFFLNTKGPTAIKLEGGPGG